MPRDLPLGNGRLLVAFDDRYRLRELYFPHAGLENHTMGRPSRVGVRTDDRTTWVGDSEWRLDLKYETDTLVTDVTATSDAARLELRFSDAVDHQRPVLVRRVVVRNLRDEPVSAKLFFHHDLEILESDAGITAFRDFRSKALVHYKRRRYFLINAQVDGVHGLAEWACGARKYYEGRGTAGQAEAVGALDLHPIAQGAVDSTFALTLALPPRGRREAFVWLIAAERYQDAVALQEAVIAEGPATWLERTRVFWRSWSRQPGDDAAPLGESHVRAYRRSLLTVRTQVDHEGAILAANDTDVLSYARDSYSYCWPRDGALVARALDDAGYPELTERFFAFCAQHVSADGYFLHKYNPDGSLASSWHPWIHDGAEQLPIQEDETALVVWALERHHARYRDFEFLAPVYDALVRRTADWMAAFRDPATGLPLPTWDLWEERHGVHAFTVAATYGGLKGAARLAETFGEAAAAQRWSAAADEIKAGFEKYLYHQELGRFVRMGVRDDRGGYRHDLKVDASLAGLFLFDLLPPGDPRLVRTMDAVAEKLSVAGPVGGVARYETDWFHQVVKDDPRVPGNPWFVCTLWLAEWRIACATSALELEPAVSWLDWAVGRALPSGIMAEQLDPLTGAPLSVSPLTWSHAAFVSACARLRARAAELGAAPPTSR
ncbi:MAG TPA: glycoside hydrolase family 15 protein [Planctomycetota bacterium]|nr:glycoside hydrolase family 15 protein [Planctomycetota bacterium]